MDRSEQALGNTLRVSNQLRRTVRRARDFGRAIDDDNAGNRSRDVVEHEAFIDEYEPPVRQSEIIHRALREVFECVPRFVRHETERAAGKRHISAQRRAAQSHETTKIVRRVRSVHTTHTVCFVGADITPRVPQCRWAGRDDRISPDTRIDPRALEENRRTAVIEGKECRPRRERFNPLGDGNGNARRCVYHGV